MKSAAYFRGATLALALLGASPSAWAFCQTTTCLPSISCEEDPEQCCILDRSGCDTNGLVVTWPSECTAYAIFQGDSVKRSITAGELSAAVDAAFERWMDADCGLSSPTLQVKPSIRAENFGLSQCDAVEVNSISGGPNANIWMFRDETWPHDDVDGGSQVNASALALTTVTFNWKTGELLDADVEVNTAQAAFTLGDEQVYIDLDSIATHEAGHFLGLDHSNDTTATMAPSYVPFTTDQRTLSLDDEHGICTSYPKNRPTSTQSCDPYGTYSAACGGGGCSVAQGPGARAAAASWMLALGGVVLFAFGVRRRRATAPRPVRVRRRR